MGDTRIQGLITLYMSDDDRLVRQAIEHFDLSRIPEGITASRYPSDLGQYIPTFSPIWVAMVHDYWMHRDAPEYVRGFLPGIRSVLGWFEGRIDETGMLGPIPWWPFVDWAKGWDRGVPPGGGEGHSTVISLQFVYALERAAELEGRLGVAGLADHYRSLAQKVRDAVRRRAWDTARGLFRDKPEGDTYSQQANVMAILTDAVAPAEQAALMERVLSDTTLTQSTYYFSYYQLEALRKAGLGERYVDQLAPWRGMLDLGLTTVPETPEPTRSDSHAWSAHPNYGLLATVLGVRPAEPGFKSVRIAPNLGPLRRAEGRVPHPQGEIVVRLARTAAAGFAPRSPCPKGSRACWSGEGRKPPCGPAARSCRFKGNDCVEIGSRPLNCNDSPERPARPRDGLRDRVRDQLLGPSRSTSIVAGQECQPVVVRRTRDDVPLRPHHDHLRRGAGRCRRGRPRSWEHGRRQSGRAVRVVCQSQSSAVLLPQGRTLASRRGEPGDDR